MNSSSGSSGHTALPVHKTPPDDVIDDITVDELPRAARNQRKRDPPDLHDIVTQHTEILAGMLAKLRAPQGQPTQQNPGVQPVVDPNFDWSRLILPPETSFQVSRDGQLQRMASSLFARVPTLAGRDQHEARLVVQVMSLWPDLDEQERMWVFQRLNV